jgi:Raf kinase inhibitor-like YbhB/YbcL family protein
MGTICTDRDETDDAGVLEKQQWAMGTRIAGSPLYRTLDLIVMNARLFPTIVYLLCFSPVFSPPLPAAEETANPEATPVEDTVNPLANPNARKVTNDKEIQAEKQAGIIGETTAPPATEVEKGEFKLTSAFESNDMIPAGNSFNGGNASPPLTITGVPAKARSLAVICENPEAERGAPWVHWVVWNIGPNIGQITSGELPPIAAVGTNSWGRKRWDGPAPLSGTHRYVFTLYALDEVLRLPETTDAKALRDAMQGHILATATLIGRYSAPK